MRLCRDYVEGRQITCAEDVAGYCKDLKAQDREFFVVIGLNTRNNAIYREIVFIGTLDASVCHPREVFKMAILKSAHSIITVHNHPSGGLTPSPEDLQSWNQLKEAGEIVGIPVVDNLIVGQTGYYSEKTPK